MLSAVNSPYQWEGVKPGKFDPTLNKTVFIFIFFGTKGAVRYREWYGYWYIDMGM